MVKVIRILVYEGSKEWIKKNLAERIVVGTYGTKGHQISEFYLYNPIPLPTDPPMEFFTEEEEELETPPPAGKDSYGSLE